jgi:hypothetical protein
VSLANLDLLAMHVQESVDLFRIMKGATRGAPGVLDSLRSNYARDAPPRGIEQESALIHLGLSMFVSFDAAARHILGDEGTALGDLGVRHAGDGRHERRHHMSGRAQLGRETPLGAVRAKSRG